MDQAKLQAAAAALCLGICAMAADAATLQVTKSAGVVTATVTGATLPNIANALPMPLPKPARAALQPSSGTATFAGAPGYSAGAPGTGDETPANAGVSKVVWDTQIAPQEYGNPSSPLGQVFNYTTSRVDARGDNTAAHYPFRAAGKLFFDDPATGYSYVCSASLIKPGVVVTAAHCVAAFGQSQFYSNWTFVPAYRNGSAPFGVWTVSGASVLTSYYDGTDSCTYAGVVCQDDVALLTLAPQTDASGASFYAGKNAGWLGYGYNGFGFYAGTSQVTQLGYPVALDGGLLMERTDSAAAVNASMSNNTIIGSLQTGGSSGGPWVANLGVKPALSGISFGNDSRANTVVGVTSWGFVDSTLKVQGAAPFTSANIVVLVKAVCGSDPAACAKP